MSAINISVTIVPGVERRGTIEIEVTALDQYRRHAVSGAANAAEEA